MTRIVWELNEVVEGKGGTALMPGSGACHLQRRTGRERAAETHRIPKGMPASAATSPETAVPATSLQAHAPETASANNVEERKGLSSRGDGAAQAREKVEAHRPVRGMPASATRSPETAVPVTYLQAHAPGTPSAKDAEGRKGLGARRQMERPASSSSTTHV